MIAWRQGEWTELPDGAEVARVHPGPSLFETFALRAGAVACLPDHLERLALACPRLGLDPARLFLGSAPRPERWQPVLRELLRRAGLTDAVVRLQVVPRDDGLATEWLTVRPLPPTPAAIDLFALRTERDRPEWLPRPKSGPWANSSAAWAELRRRTDLPSAEGVQFDAQGHVAEATRSSLAWFAARGWCFPAASTGCLSGTAAAQLRGVLLRDGAPVTETAEGFPLSAAAVLVLRSTFVGGAVPARSFADIDGRTAWTAGELPAPVVRALASLAAWRAQRAVSLA